MKWYTYTIAYSIYHNYDYISQSTFIFNSLAAFITIMTLYLAFATSYLLTPIIPHSCGTVTSYPTNVSSTHSVHS